MEPPGKQPLARSLSELADLLLKLNSRIREKISPPRKGETKGVKNTEMVIIILTHSSRAPAKDPRPQKTKSPGNDWIEELCGDIERGSSGQKSH